MDADLRTVLGVAFRALRCVDASDPSVPQTDQTFEEVTEAVDQIMRYCRERGYRVDDLRGVEPLPEMDGNV